MKPEDLSRAIRAGERVYGTLVSSTSPKWLMYIGKAGLDFVFIDMEHEALGRTIVSWMCYAYAGKGLAPIVRIPAPDPYLACQALDGGACGVLAPYVETVEEVSALRGAVKWRPLKGDKLRRFLEGEAPLEPQLHEYLSRQNQSNLLLLNIESVKAMDNLDVLLAIPEVDGVVIGPHDLSCSLGVPECYGSPVFDEAVRFILRKAREHGGGAGIHYLHGIEDERRWIGEAGLNLIIHGSDLNLFFKNMKKETDELRNV